MSIAAIIKNRRATPPRLFSKNEIPKETINALLESANWAPNHKKTEPWRFKIYTGNAKNELAKKTNSLLKARLQKGMKIAPEKVDKFKSTLERVPVAMAIVLQRDVAQRLPEWEELAAVAMAVQNMWLHATEIGLAAFWSTPGFLDVFDEIMELEEGQKCLGFFYLGETIMDYTSPGRGNMASKVEWIE